MTIAAGATPGSTSQANLNGIEPDQLFVGGSLDASEIFAVQCIVSAAGAPALERQTMQYDGAMARTAMSLGPSETLSR